MTMRALQHRLRVVEHGTGGYQKDAMDRGTTKINEFTLNISASLGWVQELQQTVVGSLER